MFVRVSTYKPSPDNTGAPSDETIRRVLALPGCRGIYYLLGKEGRSLSLTLWDDKDALDGSRETAEGIRRETSVQQQLEVLAVDEYEVLTQELKL